ncbi:MAG: alpha/beta hydrolase [Prevotellaceae bacterium]|jgi:pimeloyl-ACP methyl ester carboxylesterase|nr:alpha/beta hydrolase [Prevotellaceae bacterium]
MITNKQLVVENLLSSYTEAGEGSPLVLLHGWGCSAGTFRDLQAGLSGKFRVVAVDFPGFGRSEEPKAVWGCAEYAQWTQRFLQKINIHAPVILGHSFGGRIALVLNSRIPVSKLILTGSAGLAATSRPPKKTLAKYLPGFLKKGILREILIKIAGSDDYKRATPQMREVLKKVIAEDLRPFAEKVSIPALLIWGANDKETPLSTGIGFNAAIPASTLEIMADCGHYAFLENKDMFLHLINKFLETHD